MITHTPSLARDPGSRSNRLTIASILMYSVTLLRRQDHHFATREVQLLSLAVTQIPCRVPTRFLFLPLSAARFLSASAVSNLPVPLRQGARPRSFFTRPRRG